MAKKKLTLFGTRHWLANEVPPDVREVLKYVAKYVRPGAALEEWSDPKLGRVSAFKSVCDAASPQIPWRNIGTPSTPEYKTFTRKMGSQFHIPQYGPFDVQERREILMCENIRDAMSAYSSALLVIGEAHLHSMATKLILDFDVEAYAYYPPAPRQTPT
jgi:hypothetical protein